MADMKRRRIWVIGGALLLSVVGVTLAALFFSAQSYTYLKSGHSEAAAEAAQRAEIPVTILSTLLLNQSHSLRAWQSGLELLQTIPEVQKTVVAIPAQFTNPGSIPPTQTSSLTQDWDTISGQLLSFNQDFQQSVLAKLLPQRASQLNAVASLVNAGRQPITNLLTGSHRLAFVLQNTDELRATGGFMGSLLVIDLNQGTIEKWQLYDIYEPDGQFTGFIPAPPGVDEYLSEGKGLRLPDSNWSPDFPTAANQIHTLLEAGKIQHVDYIGAVNLSLIQDILLYTGPITLPDQQVTVTANNVNEVLRAERGEFFAGSQAKKVLLLSFMQQLLFTFQNLSPLEQEEIIKIGISAFPQKQLQLYAQDPLTQSWLEKFSLAGTLFPPVDTEYPHYFASIESNVGINKANRHLMRQIELQQLTPTSWRSKVEISYTSPTDLPYVNYHRFILNPEAEVTQLIVNDLPLTSWDSATITDSQGRNFQQLGFLAVAEPTRSAIITLEYQLPQPSTAVVLGKQSGTNLVPFKLTTLTTQHLFNLHTNMVIPLE